MNRYTGDETSLEETVREFTASEQHESETRPEIEVATRIPTASKVLPTVWTVQRGLRGQSVEGAADHNCPYCGEHTSLDEYAGLWLWRLQDAVASIYMPAPSVRRLPVFQRIHKSLLFFLFS